MNPRLKTSLLRKNKSSLLNSDRTMYFKRVGYYGYIRTDFDGSANDLVQKVNLDRTQGGTVLTENPVFDLTQTFLTAKSVAYTYAQSWESATTYQLAGDESCPAYYNGTYIGAGHGASCIYQITSASHGRTSADLGSAWTDTAAKKWYIVRIVDANTLWICPDFATDGNNVWTFSITLTGTTLTHSNGATHTGNIVFSGPTLSQLTPAIKNHNISYLVDGYITPDQVSVYKCRYIDIVESYDIVDPRTILSFMKANIGSTIQQAMADVSTAAEVNVSLIYHFASNGTCTITQSFKALNRLSGFQHGFIQANPLSYTGGNRLFLYIPKVNSYTGSVKTWQFKNVEEIGGSFENINVSSAMWSDANNPPYRFIGIVKNASGTPLIGLTLGYDVTGGSMLPATRKSVVTGKAYTILNSTKKSYPYVFSGTMLSGATLTGVSYRGYFCPSNGATVFQYFENAGTLTVYVDFHSNVTNQPLPVPSRWNGRSITVLDSDGTITINNSVVNQNAISVTTGNGYGMAVLKIT